MPREIAFDPYRRKIVRPEEFSAAHRKWREEGKRARCLACDKPVTPHAVNSANLSSSFHHGDGESCLEDDPVYKTLNPAEWDPEAEERLLAQLRDPDTVARLYARCQTICGTLSCEEFLDMCAASRRLRIWRMARMSLDLAPFIMTTLINLPKTDRRKIAMNILLRKPEGFGPGQMFVRPADCHLEKVFADSGRPMKKFAHISLLDGEILGAGTNWLSDSLRKCIQRCHLLAVPNN